MEFDKERIDMVWYNKIEKQRKLVLKVQTALNSISVPAPRTSKIDESPTHVHPVPDVKVSKDK